MSWKAQGIRFVLYQPEGVPPVDAEDVWLKLFGSSRRPDNTQRKAGPGQSQSIASGVVRSEMITISAQPRRVDVFVNAPNTDWSDKAADAPPERFLEVANHYGRKCIENYSTVRIALVSDLLKHVETPNDAYNLVVASLPFLPPLTDVQDINFQVNPRRPFSCEPSFFMNRLCRWGSAAIQVVNFQLGTGQMVTGPQPSDVVAYIFGLQTDLSSDQMHTSSINTEIAIELLNEMNSETLKIIQHGFEVLK